MATQKIYLDYNATAPLLPSVRKAIAESLEWIGNPSSIHGFGRHVRKHIELAREQIGQLVNTDATHVTFTSGATEANNWVLFNAPATRVLISAIEHASLIDASAARDNTAIIPVTPQGIVDLTALETLLQQSNEPTLVCVMWVNNETGVIQPIAAIAEICRKYQAFLHVDAVQAAGRLEIDLQKLLIDYLSLSAHKIGGPSGIGAMIYNHDTTLYKFIHGGGQERRRRAGTENILGIIGFGAAAAAARHTQQRYSELGAWRDELEQRITALNPDCIVVGADAPRVGNTMQLITPHATAEKQLMALDLAGIAVSSGSACASGSVKPSHVLRAMGIADTLTSCAIRLSMGPETRKTDLDAFFEAWVANTQRLRQD